MKAFTWYATWWVSTHFWGIYEENIFQNVPFITRNRPSLHWRPEMRLSQSCGLILQNMDKKRVLPCEDSRIEYCVTSILSWYNRLQLSWYKSWCIVTTLWLSDFYVFFTQVPPSEGVSWHHAHSELTWISHHEVESVISMWDNKELHGELTGDQLTVSSLTTVWWAHWDDHMNNSHSKLTV